MSASNNTGSAFTMTQIQKLIYYLPGVLIFLENLLTILVILRIPNLRTKTNMIIFSLAVTDFLTGIIMMIDGEIFLQNFPIATACTILWILWLTPPITSIFHLVVVTLDRYIAILYPLHYHVYFTTQRIIACLIFCWVTPLVLTTSLTTHVKWKVSRALMDTPVQLSYLLVLAIVPLSLILIVLYVQIFREIRYKHLATNSIAPTYPSNVTHNTKTTGTIFCTVGCFIVCWFPFLFCIIIVIIFNYENESGMSNTLALWTQNLLSLAMLNSAFNPIIYVLRMKSFRTGYVKLFSTLSCKKN